MQISIYKGIKRVNCKPLGYQSNMQWLSKEVAGEPDTANQKGNNMFCDYRKSKEKKDHSQPQNKKVINKKFDSHWQEDAKN